MITVGLCTTLAVCIAQLCACQCVCDFRLCVLCWVRALCSGDGDGVGTVCDKCPLHPDPLQEDNDGDGIGELVTVVRLLLGFLLYGWLHTARPRMIPRVSHERGPVVAVDIRVYELPKSSMLHPHPVPSVCWSPEAPPPHPRSSTPLLCTAGDLCDPDDDNDLILDAVGACWSAHMSASPRLLPRSDCLAQTASLRLPRSECLGQTASVTAELRLCWWSGGST